MAWRSGVLIGVMTVAAAMPVNAAGLSATVRGVEGSAGVVRISLFNEAQKHYFPLKSGKAAFHAEGLIRDGEARFTLENIPPGNYALFAYHDANNNQRMDHRWYGPPDESFAYFRDFKVKLLPPDFEDVAFGLGAEDMAVTLHLQSFSSMR